VATHTAIPKNLPQSGNTVRTWILSRFKEGQDSLRSSLAICNTAIHISFDVWTSPNHRSFLAVVGHYTDYGQGEVKNALLGFRRLLGAHTGENIAACFWSVVQDFGLERRLGYFTLDNASSNDTALAAIGRKLEALGISFDAQERRLRCFGHILNLAAKAFLWSENPLNIDDSSLDDDNDEAAELGRLQEWRKRGPLGKLYNCINYALKTPQRRERFEEKCRSYLHEEPGPVVGLILGNATRWNGDYSAIVRALRLREPLEDFIASSIRLERTSATTPASLIHDELTPEDWNDLQSMMESLAPLNTWTLALEKRGAPFQLSEVLPAFDELLTHFEERRLFHKHADDTSTPIVTSLNAAWGVLNKFVLPLRVSALQSFAHGYIGTMPCSTGPRSTTRQSPSILK
jgi:hypothetical protein